MIFTNFISYILLIYENLYKSATVQYVCQYNRAVSERNFELQAFGNLLNSSVSFVFNILRDTSATNASELINGNILCVNILLVNVELSLSFIVPIRQSANIGQTSKEMSPNTCGIFTKLIDRINRASGFNPIHHITNDDKLNRIITELSIFENRHRCPNCDRTYKWKKGLSQHLRYECGKEPQFACPYAPVCRYRTKVKSNIKYHVKNIHKIEHIKTQLLISFFDL
nr:unnamed protein product [Callosobruchus chinensis]